ncbi:Ku protein [Zavarzinia sp. CC-PAN008]|uniref:non-homologous end joining protein Ku n=1 Tax=Zavarzinia sp. CC-PAN008 TaxID=3243332 RepID=UPI003F7488D2
MPKRAPATERRGRAIPGARNAFWKGYLKLSLVTCPVVMQPATTESAKVRFHTLNRATGNRIEARMVDGETGKVVEADDIVRGYQHADDKLILLDDDELDRVALESTRTIDVETFVPADTIGAVWLDRPHYLMPGDSVGAEAFAVIRAAMAATNRVGIARLVLYRRERAVMLEPRDNGIVLWTLRYGDEVRPDDEAFEGLDKARADAGAVKLVSTLIKQRSRDWSPDLVKDPVQAGLKALIAQKSRKTAPKRKAAKAEAEEAPSNVVNIMDALRKSLEGEKARPRR